MCERQQANNNGISNRSIHNRSKGIVDSKKTFIFVPRPSLPLLRRKTEEQIYLQRNGEGEDEVSSQKIVLKK